jgi:hypothetical protein
MLYWILRFVGSCFISCLCASAAAILSFVVFLVFIELPAELEQAVGIQSAAVGIFVIMAMPLTGVIFLPIAKYLFHRRKFGPYRAIALGIGATAISLVVIVRMITSDWQALLYALYIAVGYGPVLGARFWWITIKETDASRTGLDIPVQMQPHNTRRYFATIALALFAWSSAAYLTLLLP